MPKHRKRRDPKILDFFSPQRWISSLGANLNVINPHQGANPHGNCEACSIHAAMVLTTTTKPSVVGAVVQSADSIYQEIDSFDEGHKRADKVWAALNSDAVPYGVYLLTDEDHTFNMLRDGKGLLFLVDSNLQIYKWVQSSRDCAVIALGDDEDGALHNPLGPGEGEMEIYYCGQLHKRWR